MRALVLAACLPVLVAPASGQADPNGHRLFFSPTAEPVRAGGVTVGLASVVVPNVTVGLGRGATLGAGAVLHPEGWGVVFVEPKWTAYTSDRLDLAVGATGRLDLESGVLHALPYVVVTATHRGAAVTAGLGGRVDHADRFVGPPPDACSRCGAGATADEVVRATERSWWVARRPSASLGARVALGPGLDAIAEAVAYPTPTADAYGGLAGLGVRLRYRRAAVDLGAVAFSTWEAGDRSTEVGPWLNVGVGF